MTRGAGDTYALAHRHLVQPAGMKPAEVNAVADGPDVRTRDRPLPARARRPCSNCGRKFAQTYKRRLLCARCFTGNDDMAA